MQKFTIMSSIVVIGSTNTDMVVKTTRFPLPGETILGGEFFMFPGGKGANQAVAAARMGGKVTLVGKVGKDVFGKEALAGFQKEGIIVDYISEDPTAGSGVALITVDEKGENSIVVASGANGKLNEADIIKAKEAIEEAGIVLLQLEVPLPAVTFAAKLASELGKKVVLNPAPAQALPSELYTHLHLITPNESEAFLLTGIEVNDTESAEKAADMLLSFGVENVIITLGSQGAYLKNKEASFMINAQKVTAVDTTAAGDVFNGSLAVFLGEHMPWKEAIHLACAAATLSVTRMGAQSSAPFRAEIEHVQ